jgi:DNA-binding response OmpR family regulator
MIRGNRVDADTVLYIGRAGNHAESYLEGLKKRYTVATVSSGREAIDHANGHSPRAVILDAASMRTPGDRVCRTLRSAFPEAPIIHIVPQDTGALVTPAEIVLKPPLTSRRLLANVKRVLVMGQDEILTCGPYTINVARRLLTRDGREVQLNPKVALLLEYFFRQPNQTIDRKALMKSIWQTDYLGDTRTLDVHIRWAREALEDGGRYPRCLKTVRGVGYLLEPISE